MSKHNAATLDILLLALKIDQLRTEDPAKYARIMRKIRRQSKARAA